MPDRIEIRRIADEEGDPVAELWDRMCREIPDGGPLTPKGKRNIARWLTVSAFHAHAFCLVAVDNSTIVGFVNGRTDIGDGLLPGTLGVVESLYVVSESRGVGLSRRLARAAVDWLREHGASTIRTDICIDNTEARDFWIGLGFDADMVCMSLYE
jgi:GNAT superfamily N-acetyltransferase